MCGWSCHSPKGSNVASTGEPETTMTDRHNEDTFGSSLEADGGVARSDVYAPTEEGREYRETVYRDVNYDSLETASEANSYPKSEDKGKFKLIDLPRVPKLSHVIGPSAIMLGASLGSGETLFWPLVIAQAGWGVYWAFWVGVLTQFFINTELQRWTMATGESIFRGYFRLNSVWPWLLLLAGFFHVGWPGWAASGSQVFAAWTGVVPESQWWIIGIASMILIWLSYQLGPVLYNIVEKAQLVLMVIAIALAVLLMFVVGSVGELAGVPGGAVNFGALPQDMGIATFLGGLAYAGAGGYVNLVQGIWAREKGYGMGTYQGRMKNPVRGGDDPEEIHGAYTFEPTETNLQRWKGWWKLAQQEHFVTFVVGILVVATIVMTIAARYVPLEQDVSDAINMWLSIIAPQLGGTGQFMLYALLFIALFSTQYAIVDLFVRNSADIVFEMYGRGVGWDVGRLFLGVLTLYTLWGIAIMGFQFQQPFILLVIGAAIAGVMMWPYNALTIILNTTRLPEHVQPGWGRVVAMWWATGFFGFFSVLLISSTLIEYFGLTFFETSPAIVGSNVGGYLLWLLFVGVQVYTMYRSARAKRNASGTVDGAEEASGFLA